MGSVPPELSLDFRPTFVPKTITSFFKEVSLIGNVSDKVSKLDTFVKRLEEEMRKIDAFKRELPLCMILLNDAIVALKEESMQCMSRNVEPVLEEFIPLKNKKGSSQSEEDGALITNKKEKDSNNSGNCNNNKDKKTWMSSVQLWNTDRDCSIDRKLDSKQRNIGDSTQGCKNQGGATACMPFKADLSFAMNHVQRDQGQVVPGQFLLLPPMLSQIFGLYHQQTARKQRRCWSPELHCRFVNALQQLGGSQVATPKLIRELMQVDGLTNDEVKSHLQKYRLHRRRLSPSTASPANQAVVVLGAGLWMSQDQQGESSKGSSSQSDSPQGPL
ncbi:hypothetical protein GQ457_15G014020 [Hibiscus cannabinus]